MKGTLREVWRDLIATARLLAEREGLTFGEVVLFEPGWKALARYRLAHAFWRGGFRGFARWLTGGARRSTGIHIHPGARVGRRCVIVAGGGVVIGETAYIGDDCLIEPGVMLLSGGMAVGRDAADLVDLPPGVDTERVHPTVGKRAILEGGAILVGDIFLGDGVRVLSGAVVTRDVQDGGYVVGSPGRTLRGAQVRPDPDARAVQAMADRLYKLEEQVQIVAFTAQRQQGAEPWRTRNPEHYGPIAAVEALIDGAGI